ncbi:MAG: hypothetical protein Q7T62_10480 [Undibacterium sp.]|nr:hypothetical protein [Undibacterium sp.]
MKEVKGVLKTLGSGSTTHGNVGSSFVKYNTIEIGDTLLQKIVTAQSLNDFVERGLGEEVTLFLNGKMLIGVKLSSGKIYYWKRSIFLFLYNVIFSLFLLGFTIPIGGMTGNFFIPMLFALGLIFFITKPFIMQTLIYQPKLSSLGGISLKG